MIASLTGKPTFWTAALVAFSLLTLTFSGCAKAPKPTDSGPVSASWEELQTTLKAAQKSKIYQKGLAAAAQSRRVSPETEQGKILSYFNAVRFAASLTQPQMTQLQKQGKLLYSELTQEQQNHLKSFAEIYSDNPTYQRIQESFVMIVRYPQVGSGTGTGIDVRVPSKSGKGTDGIFTSLEPFLKD